MGFKTIRFKNEFDETEKIKALCDGIYWNEMCESWSVYPHWGHAMCATISQAKRSFRSRWNGEYKILKDGVMFPVFIMPPIMKGGHSHRRNYGRCCFCGNLARKVYDKDLDERVDGACKKCRSRMSIHRKAMKEFK